MLPFVLSLAVAMSLLPLLARLAGRLNIVDSPGDRKVHSHAIPRIGGVAMAAGVVAAVSSLLPDLGRSAVWFLAGAAVLMAFGVADDRFDLDYRAKFVGQLLAVALPVFGGEVWIHSLTTVDHIELPAWLGIGLTVVFLVGVTNAVNLADGLDGLAGGMSFLCLCALAWLAHLAGQEVATMLSLAFAGAALGFLRYNTHPAVVFMGDAGSQLLGYAIGVLALLATQNPTTAVSASLPVLLLGVPILDTLQVMTRRVAAGHSPFRPDRGHLHHRLLALGLEHHEAVSVLYAAQAALFLLAYWERFDSDLVILGTYALLAAAILVGLVALERSDWRLREPALPESPVAPLTRLIGRAYQGGGLQRASALIVCAGLAGYALLCVYEARALPPEFKAVVWVLAGALAALLLVRRNQPLSGIDRATLYATLAALVYCDASVPAGARLLPYVDWVVLLAVALATVVALRAGRTRGFQVSPLDLLVVFIALVVPNLPGIGALPTNSAQGIAKLVLLYYGLEVAASTGQRHPAWVRLTGFALLAGLAAEFPMTFA